MSLTEADIDPRNGSRSSSNDSICVENQQPPAEIDENNFDQLRQKDIPWDHVDMVTFVDSQGQQKSMLYGEYLKKDYRSHKSERLKTHVYGYDTQLRELLTPDEFAKHTHTVRSNLTEKVNQLAAQLNALNGLFKGNLDELVAKVLNTNVL